MITLNTVLPKIIVRSEEKRRLLILRLYHLSTKGMPRPLQTRITDGLFVYSAKVKIAFSQVIVQICATICSSELIQDRVSLKV